MNHITSPDTSDAGIERLIQAKGLPRESRLRKIWPLMGYELRSKLAGA